MSPPVNHADVEFIVAEMHRMHEEVRGDIKILRYEQQAQGKKVAGLEVKSGFWGALGGLVPAGLLVAGLFIKQIFGGTAH